MKNKTNKEIGPFNLTPIEIKFVVNQFYKKFENKTITESIAKLYNIESKNISYLSQDFLQENLNYKVEIAKQLKIIQLIPILQGQNGASNRQCSQQKRDMYIDSQENISDHLKISLPAIPQNLVKMKKQTLIADVNIKPLKFDVIEILYDDFFQFASKHASKNRIYLHNLVYLWNNSPFYFNQIRKINNILILNYEATVNQDCNNDNRNDIQYRNLSDLLQDLDKFLLLRELSVVIFRSKNQNCLSYPLKILQYVSSKKRDLERLNLKFNKFNQEDIIDPKFCEELQKCINLKSLGIFFEQVQSQVSNSSLITDCVFSMQNLSDISINIPIDCDQLKDQQPTIQILRKDQQNIWLKKLKIEQKTDKQGNDFFSYDLSCLLQAPNLEELEISCFAAKFNEEYLKYSVKEILQKLEKLTKITFSFKYSEVGQQIQIIKSEIKNFKNLQVFATRGYFDDNSYFYLEYNKSGIIQTMFLGFQKCNDQALFDSTILENKIRLEILQQEIQNSQNCLHFASFEIYQGTFQRQSFINLMKFLKDKIKKIYLLRLEVNFENFLIYSDEEKIGLQFWLKKQYKFAAQIQVF